MKNDQRAASRCFDERQRWLNFALSFWLILLANPETVFAQSRSLVVAVEDDAAPWSRRDGTGYANDVVTAAFKAAGVDVKLLVVPYARCKRMAVNGQVAGCLSMSPSPEFKDTIELSATPLFVCTAGYFYNVNKPPRAGKQEDLPAMTVVGTVLGYEYPASFERLRERGVIVRQESPSEELNLKKLALGRVDLALLTYNDVKSPELLMARAKVKGIVKQTFNAGLLKSYVGFSNCFAPLVKSSSVNGGNPGGGAAVVSGELAVKFH